MYISIKQNHFYVNVNLSLNKLKNEMKRYTFNNAHKSRIHIKWELKI